MQFSFVYIVANKKNGTLYVGVCSDLVRRISEHRSKQLAGFTKRYDLTELVYYEVFEDITQAIAREKQLKHFKRAWKIRLIEKNNPKWRDLWDEITGSPARPAGSGSYDPAGDDDMGVSFFPVDTKCRSGVDASRESTTTGDNTKESP